MPLISILAWKERTVSYMRILAIEKDPDVRELYVSYLTRKRYDTVRAVESIHPVLLTDLSQYDVVITDGDSVVTQLHNIPLNHVIVASGNATSKKTGTWAITKPFHMEELAEMLECIEGQFKVSQMPKTAGGWQ